MEILGAGPNIILISDANGNHPGMRSYALRLVDEGWRVALIGDWNAQSDWDISDAQGLSAIRNARDHLGRPVICVGFGLGGLLARIAACTLTGIHGAVDIGGRLVYPCITPEKPAQPLDLLPGLSCALQGHYPEDDPNLSEADLSEFENRMAWRNVPFQLFRYPNCNAGFYDPTHASYDPDAAERAWYRTVRFLDSLRPTA